MKSWTNDSIVPIVFKRNYILGFSNGLLCLIADQKQISPFNLWPARCGTQEKLADNLFIFIKLFCLGQFGRIKIKIFGGLNG